MNLNFIIKSSIFLSIPGVSVFLLRYLSDPDPNAFFLITINVLIVIALMIALVRSYVYLELKNNEFPGFIQYFVTFILILSISTSIHFSIQYLVYNHLDTDYKYESEEAFYQKVKNHRIEKGLPLPRRISEEAIAEKYGFGGLFEYFKTYYVLDFITALLFYLIAVGFYKIKTG